MKFAVERRRVPSRRVATLVVSKDDLAQALDRLRSWALTRGTEIESELSWVEEQEGRVEARCPVSSDIEAHPDTGIAMRRIPSRYEASVAVTEPAPDPQEISAKLLDWAGQSGYLATGAAEVFVPRVGAPGHTVALPIRRKPAIDYIEV